MEKTALFTGRAHSYAKGRPDYSEELLAFLFETIGFYPGCSVADFGAGTGIFSQQLLRRGCRVACVEPNADMRGIAEQTLAGYDGARILNGDAGNSGLEAASVDFITAAQAFHWFDVPAFQAESRRILKPGGKSVLIWNLRDPDSAFNQAHAELFARYCPRFRGFTGGVVPNDPRIGVYFQGRYQMAEFDHPLWYDKAKFLERSFSASYSLREEDAAFPAYRAALERLFDRFAQDQRLPVPNRSIAYWGEV